MTGNAKSACCLRECDWSQRIAAHGIHGPPRVMGTRPAPDPYPSAHPYPSSKSNPNPNKSPNSAMCSLVVTGRTYGLPTVGHSFDHLTPTLAPAISGLRAHRSRQYVTHLKILNTFMKERTVKELKLKPVAKVLLI